MRDARVAARVPAGPDREREGPCPWYDVVAAVLSFACGVHVALRYPALTEQVAELPTEVMVTAVIMTPLILEGLRRTAGKAIAIVALSFLVLALVADQLPGSLTGRPIPLDRLLFYLIWDSTAALRLAMMIISTIVVAFIMFGQALFLTGGSSFFTDISLALMGRHRGGAVPGRDRRRIHDEAARPGGLNASGARRRNDVYDGRITTPA